MPSVDGEVMRSIDESARELGLDVLVTPPVDQLFGGVGLADIRPISHDDLLGRRVAEIDPVAIAGYVRDRRVLVTGAGWVDRGRALPPDPAIRARRAAHARPRRVGPARHPAVGRGAGDARQPAPHPRRHPRRRPRRRHHGRLPARDRVPRGGAQAPAPARVTPRGGVEDQRARHAQPARLGVAARCRDVRQRQHRQGCEPDERARLDQAADRAAHGVDRRLERHDRGVGAIRQRLGLERIGAQDVRGPGRQRRAPSP